MKRAVKYLIALGCIVTLAGCAHRQALERADNYAQQGDWRAALSSCWEAKQAEPESKEAQACIERTRPRAIEVGLDDAQIALDAGDYAAAIDHLDYVDQISAEPSEEAAELREDVHTTLRAHLTSAIEEGQMEQAYQLANTAADLYPGASYLDASFARIRSYLLARADKLEEQGAFEEALASLAMVATYEPGRRAEIDVKYQRVHRAWVSSLVERAREHDRQGRPGAALALFARAYELSGEPSEGVQVKRLGRQLQDGGFYSVHWQMQGSDSWKSQIDRFLRREVGAQRQVVRASSPEKADLEVTLVLADAGCEQAPVETSVRTKNYVAGTREISNPAYIERQERLEQVVQRLHNVRSTKKKLEGDYVEHHQKSEAIRQNHLVPLEYQINATSNEIQSLESEVQAYADMVAQGEEQLERLRREQASDEAISAQQMTLNTARQTLEDKKVKRGVARERQARLEREYDSHLQAYEVSRSRAQERAQKVQEVASRLHELQRVKRELQNQLANTSQTIDEDIIRSFEYNVVSWARTCEAKVDVRTKLALSDEEAHSKLHYENTTRDETHPAFAAYGVSEDVLVFPDTDDELWASIDTTVASKVGEAIANGAQAHYQYEIDQAIAAMVDRPHEATDRMLALYLAAPAQLEADEVEALEKHLLEHYGTSPLDALSKL